MRPSLSLLMIVACTVAPIAWAQTAAQQPAATPPTATAPQAAHPSRHPSSRHSQPRHVPATTQETAPAGKAGGEPAGKAGGVLELGATDITGNKELPKVMVIVPWKDSLGADGVIKPTDSLMDEVLGPVDRGVFQRQVRYYGQLNAAADRPATARVAPVGDSH